MTYEKTASRCENQGMEAYPTPTTDHMAVEPNDVTESAAERQGPGPEVLLDDADLESPSLQLRSRASRHLRSGCKRTEQ